MKYLVDLCVNFYVTYFCLVGVRLKRDTLRSLPLETIIEWELVLGKDGQLVRNNNVGIVIVLFMCCRCLLVHKVLKKLLTSCVHYYSLVVLSTYNGVFQ